jgi:hypothetical protein
VEEGSGEVAVDEGRCERSHLQGGVKTRLESRRTRAANVIRVEKTRAGRVIRVSRRGSRASEAGKCQLEST